MRRGIFLGLICVMLLTTLVGASPEIADEINKELKNQETVPVAIIMKEGVDISTLDQPTEKKILFFTIESDPIAEEITNKQDLENYNSVYGRITEEGIEKLESNPDVEQVLYMPPWEVTLSDSTMLLNATMTWLEQPNSINLTGTGETICVIDTGVNYSHSNLGGCDTANFTDGNCSKVIGGYDFCADDVNCTTSDNDPIDVHGHGTHVAGTVAANGTIKGVAPGAKLVIMKTCNSSGSCFQASIVNSINWCVSNAPTYNISVITMSLGGGLYSDYCDAYSPNEAAAINNAVANNITVTVASGNQGSTTHISSPGCIENATAVGAVSKTNVFSYNTNSLVDVVATGISIVSTCITGSTCSKSGTSMATPHAAGFAALLQQARKIQTNSSFTKDELESTMELYGDNLTDPGSGLQFPRINVYSSIDSLTTPSYTWVTNPNRSIVNQDLLINLTTSDLFLGVQNATITINSTTYLMNKSGDSFSFLYNAPDTLSMIYNVTVYDRVNSNTTESTTLVIGDSISPTYTNQSSIGVDFSPLISMNITWQDEFNISEAWVSLDGINYTAGNITNLGNIFFFNISHAAGTYNLTWYANDTSGNVNSTGVQAFKIYQADPRINLTLRVEGIAYNSNVPTQNATDTEINATSSGEGPIQVYVNNTFLAQGASTSNLTNFTSATQNITVFYDETQNYSLTYKTYFIYVEDSSAIPRVYKENPLNNNYSNNETVYFSANAFDTSLSNLTLYIFNSTSEVYTNTSSITGRINETFWTKELEDGNYTWSAKATDTGSNSNMTTNTTFVVDTIKPLSTISLSANAITTADTVGITCTSSDTNLDEIHLLIDEYEYNATTNLSAIKYTFNPTAIGVNTTNCTSVDRAGNINSTNLTITVSAPSNNNNGGGGGGGGGSGGGGGASSTSSAGSSSTSFTFTKVAAGTPADLRASEETKKATAVSEVSINLKKTVYNFKLILSEESSPETPVRESNTKVLKYISLDHSQIKETDVNNAELKFEVEKAWIDRNKLDKDSITMKRFSAGSWSNLKTTILLETPSKIHYSAISPGLSTFAITAKEVVEVKAPEPTPTPIPAPVKMGESWQYILIVILSLTALIIIGYVVRIKLIERKPLTMQDLKTSEAFKV